MKVFITWSGDISHQVAKILHDWLPDIIQPVEPFLSSEDIRKGNRWNQAIAEELDAAHYGIACLTRTSRDSSWLLYEAGAISKDIDRSYLWTVLIGGLSFDELEGPLRQFQHTEIEQSDFKKLVKSVNDALPEDERLSDTRLDRLYQKLWPDLKTEVETVLQDATEDVTEERKRDSDDILGELLDLTRDIANRPNIGTAQKRPFLTRDYQVVINIVPDVEKEEVQSFLNTLTGDSKIRKAGIMSFGRGGVGGDISQLHIQTHHPVSRERILELGEDSPIEIIDIYHRPLPLQDVSE